MTPKWSGACQIHDPYTHQRLVEGAANEFAFMHRQVRNLAGSNCGSISSKIGTEWRVIG